MSGYIIQVNQITTGPTGHVNVTYIAAGINATYGANLSPGSGVQLESNAGRIVANTAQISVTQEQFERSLNFSRAADALNNSYFGLCNNCVDFANEALKSAGKGDWAIADYLKDGTLTDTYAKTAKYICGNEYVDRATSNMLNLLANTQNLSDATNFVNALSWLTDHETNSGFYNDLIDPDFEADRMLDRLVYYAQKLKITVKFDPIANKVMLGVASPIVVDLNGDGIQTSSYFDHNVRFDIDGDGVLDKTAWISGEDAFLAIDSNENGKIDGVHELFGGIARGIGYAKLALLDDNKDGVLNAQDKNYALLKLWQDKNMNGETDDGELQDAATAGLDFISVTYSSQDVYQNGNLIGEVSGAQINGRTAEAADVYFRYISGEILEQAFNSGISDIYHQDGELIPEVLAASMEFVQQAPLEPQSVMAQHTENWSAFTA